MVYGKNGRSQCLVRQSLCVALTPEGTETFFRETGRSSDLSLPSDGLPVRHGPSQWHNVWVRRESQQRVLSPISTAFPFNHAPQSANQFHRDKITIIF